MLTHLSIKNFAIIEHTEIDFTNKMTVITGETGAGKSILLDSLNFVLGARLEKYFLKNDKVTDISAIFSIKNNINAKTLLKNIFIDNDNECIIRRTVNKNGQSRAFINGVPMKISFIKELSNSLINIYSQNSHQNLLDSKIQLNLLDNYANNDELLNKISISFKKISNINNKISEYKKFVEKKASQKELLEYKLNELLQIELLENEFEILTKEHKSLSEADNKILSLNNICQMLYESDENIISQISFLEKELNNLSKENSFNNLYELISQIKIYAQESYDEAKNIIDNIQQNPEKLLNIENRMSIIYDLARKHKVEPNYLYKYIQELQTELYNISNDNNILTNLLIEKEQLQKEYITLANQLTKIRKKVAQDFSKAVEKNIQSLNIPKGTFVVDISKLDKQTPQGIDNCEFLINFNLGENLSPIKKVASGGELSRIGLSIQAVSAFKGAYPTLVFDEVDVGISGATAEIVGKLLKELSNKLQIICITHQAQVAVQGDIHLHISKKYLKDSTQSNIIELNQIQRINEIAKIVGGVDISKNTLKHAKEMLNKYN